MTRDIVLSIDQGTTGTTVLAVDAELRVVARSTHEFRQIFPRPGWVEHDLDDIWASVLQGLRAVLKTVDPSRVAAIGITNQRETVGLWGREDGRPLHHAIVWQDRRTADLCRRLETDGMGPRIQELTGLVIDPYFSSTKIRWLLDNVDDAQRRAEAGEVMIGTIDSFLVHRLTGGQALVTDVSNASRTMLMELATQSWSDELLEAFSIPSAALAEIRSCSEVYGATRGVPGLPDGLPIAGMAGDQQAALFGQACFAKGDVKCTYGTGAFILMNTGTSIARSRHGLVSSVAWKFGDQPPTFALEGSVFVAGAAVQWLRDGLGLIPEAPAIEALAASVPNSEELVFVPALTGLGAPHWRPEARGAIVGIGRDTTAAHLARATLEGIALQVYEVVKAMEEDVGHLNPIRVDGGASANDLLMQLQADLARQQVVRPQMLETTAAGAAFLAGLCAGVFDSVDMIADSWREERTFDPGPSDVVEALIEKWKIALTKL